MLTSMRRLEFRQRYLTDIGSIAVVTLVSVIAMIGDGPWKICQTCMPRGKFKHRYWFFAAAPNIARIVELFEKTYDGGPILTVVSNIGEDVQYRCFN